MYGRIDALNDRMDSGQDETNARFDAMHAENSRQHDDLNRRFDEMFEVLRAFEGRISHLEGRLDKQATGDAEQRGLRVTPLHRHGELVDQERLYRLENDWLRRVPGRSVHGHSLVALCLDLGYSARWWAQAA